MAKNRSWFSDYAYLMQMSGDSQSPCDAASSALKKAAEAIASTQEPATAESVAQTHVEVMKAMDAIHAMVVHYALTLRQQGVTRAVVSDALSTSPNQISKWEAAAADGSGFDIDPETMKRQERMSVSDPNLMRVDDSVADRPFPSGLPLISQLPV